MSQTQVEAKQPTPTKRLRNVLVIFKKSTYQLDAIELKDPRLLRLLAEGSATVANMERAHAEHQATLDTVVGVLASRQIAYTLADRGRVGSVPHDSDLVIAVGGDGTILHSSHALTGQPILGVNSAPTTSFGHFCLARGETFASLLDEIESGHCRPSRLMRLELTLNGTTLTEPVLNEVLVCHSSPAGQSRYFIELDGKLEEQRSSGVVIGPPPGSTGTLRGAGGVVLPITDQRFQYLVREPGMRPGERWQLLGGLLERQAQVKLVSLMKTGKLFIDGQNLEYHFCRGDELIVRASPHDLHLFIDPSVNDYAQR